MMRGLKIFLLIVISILVVFGGWIYLTAMGAERTLLNTDYYRELFNETDLTRVLYSELKENMPDILLEQMAEEFNGEMPEEEQELMSARLNIMVSFFTRAFDEAWFEEQLMLVISDVLAFARGEQQSLTAIIDFRAGKERFREELSAEIEQLPADFRDKLDMPPETIDYMLEEMGIPDQLIMSELLAEHVEQSELKAAIATQRLARWVYLYLSYAFFAFCLLISCLLAGFSGGLKWFGGATLFFSSTYLIGLQLFRVIFSPVFLGTVASNFTFVPNLFSAAIQYTVNVMSVLPLICAAIGLALVLIGVICSRLKRKG